MSKQKTESLAERTKKSAEKEIAEVKNMANGFLASGGADPLKRGADHSKNVRQALSAVHEISPMYNDLLTLYSSDDISEDEREKVLDQLMQVSDLFEDEVLNLVKYKENLDDEIETLNRRVEQWQNMISFREVLIGKIKTALMNQMISAKIPELKVKVERWLVWVQNSPPSVLAPPLSQTEIAALPEDLRRIIPMTYEIDKKAILARWKERRELEEKLYSVTTRDEERTEIQTKMKNIELPLGFEVTQGKHLRIKG